ncbi:MAG: hypothetical protein A2V93_00895 [Ignavibacteria bacterium RBG_16_34_14]|nr:MAG: hypothetical protein A2V93_00895 [Ignavibacteria bacterium RBG_16_34_14]
MKKINYKFFVFSRNFYLSNLISILLLLIGCQYVSYFDSISYKNLTDLKGEMKVAFQSFAENGAKGEEDFKVIENFKIESSKGYEYEKGKNKNDDTIAQWKIIDSLIIETVQRFKSQNNELSAGYCEAKWEILETAFDIAIATENGKLSEK